MHVQAHYSENVLAFAMCRLVFQGGIMTLETLVHITAIVAALAATIVALVETVKTLLEIYKLRKELVKLEE
jgi:hypothetical protein